MSMPGASVLDLADTYSTLVMELLYPPSKWVRISGLLFAIGRTFSRDGSS